MSANYPNRAPTRKVIAALLATALTGKAQVENYLVIDPTGKAPLACVTSSNTGVLIESYGGTAVDLFYEVRVMVVYAQGATWTPDKCEDLSDEICKICLDTLADNAVRPVDVNGVGWTLMQVDRPTVTSIEPIGGVPYRTEIIPFAVRVSLSDNAA